MKKYIYILAAVAAVFLCFLLYALIPKPFKWNFEQADPDGHEPYDMAVFDELMNRSLPKGYEVVELEPATKALDLTQKLDPKKQSVLFIQRFKLADADNKLVRPLIAALEYANAGGDVLLVREQLDARDPFVRELTDILDKPYDFGGYNSPSNYYPENLSDREDEVFWIVVGKDTIKIHNRFAPTYYKINWVPNNRNSSEVSDLEDLVSEERSPEADEAAGLLRKMTLSFEPYLQCDNTVICYGLKFHNEKTGGNVYICTLGMYFTNLGVTLPDADKVIAYNMEQISQKPVVRVEYNHRKTKSSSTVQDSEENKIFSVLSKNKALSFAWLLVIILAVLALLCGLYRKHPAKKDAHLVDVDQTDPVAVREARFRQSPLLHFIFQYSWLYHGQRNYTDLFLINYRQFARYVNRKSGMELGSANDNDLIVASKTLALRTGLDAAVVKQDLLWMQNTKLNADADDTISPSEYVKSQHIIEKYI